MNPLRIIQGKTNRFWQEYGYHHGQVRLRNLPEIFAIESTNYCNLKCIMCPRGEPDIMDRPLGHMATSVFQKIVDEWQFYTDPCWFHWFGEPLMNPRLFEQIQYAKKKGVPNLGISTNATLMNDKNNLKILDSGLDTILVAIDGTRKETYESIRKSPEFTFEEVTQNVRNFLALKKSLGRHLPHTILSIIVMEETKSELQDFTNYWLALGANEVLHKQYTIWSEPDFVTLAPTAEIPRLTSWQRAHPCKLLWQSVVITWNGHVVPCCFDFNETAVLGDLNKQSLREIWNSEKYMTFRRNEMEGKNDAPICRNCKEAPGHERNPHWPI